MKKLISYVVFERGYEYNDETYNETNSTGGNPKRVTFSKEDADRLVKELSRDSFRGLCIGQYSYELDELVDVELLKSVFEKNKWKWDIDDLTIPQKASDEQIDKVIDIVNLTFFDYLEVELDVNSMRDVQIKRVNDEF